MSCDGVVLVSDRISNDSLYYELKPALEEGKLNSLRVIGDAEAPNIIAQAVFSGHLAAREFEEEKVEGTPFKVERMKILGKRLPLRRFYQTRSRFGLSSGFRPTLAISIHSSCTFTRTTSPVKSVTVPPLLLNSHEPTA